MIVKPQLIVQLLLKDGEGAGAERGVGERNAKHKAPHWSRKSNLKTQSEGAKAAEINIYARLKAERLKLRLSGGKSMCGGRVTFICPCQFSSGPISEFSSLYILA